MNELFEINVHESTHTYANPYWLWIQIHIQDERFYFYIKDTCTSKKVSLFEFNEPFRQKFLLPSYFVYVDRLDNLIKGHRQYIHPNNVSEIDITEDMQFSFETEKLRERFKKQFIRQVENFLTREHKTYMKLLAKIGQ